MNILTRYVLGELTKVFLVCLATLTLLMLIVGVVREAAAQQLPPAQLLQLIPFILPDVLRMTIPVTLLLATTSVYGRMSGSNEVVAAKALGISPMKLLWPAFVAAFLISLAAVWLNDLAVSWGRSGAEQVVFGAVEDIAYNMLRTQRRYSSRSFSINVQRVDGRRLIRPTVSIPSRGKNTPSITITAEEAALQSDYAAEVLKIILRNGRVEAEGLVTMEFPDVWEKEIPLSDASRAKTSTTPSSMALWEIPEEIVAQEESIGRLDHEMAARAAYQMLCGDFQQLADPQDWKSLAGQRTRHQNVLYRLRLEPQRRWAAGFSCLFFVWVGAPVAIYFRKGEFLTSFFVCFLPILIVYYPLLAYGIDGAKNGTIPPQGVWAGNLLLLGCGVWMLRKVIRY